MKYYNYLVVHPNTNCVPLFKKSPWYPLYFWTLWIIVNIVEFDDFHKLKKLN